MAGHGLGYLVVDARIVGGMMRQSEANGAYPRHEVELEHAFRCMTDEGRHDDEQPVLGGRGLAEVADKGDVLGQGALQIVGTLVANFQEQGRRLVVYEGKDAVVHIAAIAGNGPSETLFQHVERPQPHVVALGRDDGRGS